MKRTIAAVTFLLASAALVKLAIKPAVDIARTNPATVAAASGSSARVASETGESAQTELEVKYKSGAARDA